MAIAVVIPLYNHERYIGEAIESVRAQARPVDKIVIVDDGSRDGSVDAVRKINDARIELFTQKNAGAHVALNRAVAAAARDCEFIAILNSDDVYEPARIEKCVGFLETHPPVDLVCTRLRMVDEENRLLHAADPKTRWIDRLWRARREHLGEWLGIANFAKTSSNFVARSSFLLANPFRPYRYVHDYFLVLIAALENRLGVLDEELLRYRTHASNTIRSDPHEKVTREVIAMNIDLLRELSPRLAESPELRANYSRYFRVLCQNYAEFRAEVFMHLIAKILRDESDELLAKRLQSLNAGQFPELIEPKRDQLKNDLADAECDALLRQIASSRWLALGRVFGAELDVLSDAPTAGKRLERLKKSCASSRWFRLGQQLGFVYTDV